MASSSSDIDKLFQAFGDLNKMFGSWENLLDAFGLLHMPTAQRYGILFGCLTFAGTIGAVLCLLAFGGSFQRIAEQEEGDVTVVHSHMIRSERALLLERLLDARERMAKFYPPLMVKEGMLSNLTQLLLNEHGTIVENSSKDDEKKDGDPRTSSSAVKRQFPPGYQANYEVAYRRCQDAPGGPALTGQPEARYEAYARGFAACGNYTNLSYRRSYARVYEAVSCDNHKTDDKYSKLFKERPQDIIGKLVRLEALEPDRHLNQVFDLTSGAPDLETKSYDPEEVWGFLEEGPFRNKQELAKSFVFQRKINEAAFAIINNITDKLVGVVLLTNDNPQNLGIQLEPPIMRPTMDGSQEQLEACYLLLDRLFALGYRRCQMSMDHQDAPARKLALRLGYTLEGTVFKHMIVKDSSRDSVLYGLLNSDWDKGARFALFKKLYGVAAAQADVRNRKKEEEMDEQKRVLALNAAKDKNL
ncbi:-acetyltransferase [Seminavis robusta]|uniref:-acetyltransferase n=1 Tax=Seminavis robusta TaxID=568900 RepID=A0A9N8DNH5_9STRA|nr:-acetyltransferase [Seminavis robusta]|eukprot:Sro236_g094980.1 -acetyltransferase (472) ;mRNA; r:43304-44922